MAKETFYKCERQGKTVEFYTDGTYQVSTLDELSHWKFKDNELYFKLDEDREWTKWIRSNHQDYADKIGIEILEILRNIDNILVGGDDE